MYFSSQKSFFLFFVLLLFTTPHLLRASTLDFSLEDEKVAVKRYSFGIHDMPPKYDSDHIVDWHVAKSQLLFDAYNVWQPGVPIPRRNVLIAMVSLLYREDGTLYMNHYEIPAVFINGWQRNDGPVNSPQLPVVALEESGKTLEECKQLEIIPANSQLERRGFKKRYCHTEISVLAYLNRYCWILSKNLTDELNPRRVAIEAVVLNLASLRDICTPCQEILNGQPNFGRDCIASLAEKYRDEFSRDFREISEDFSFIILGSGMSKYTIRRGQSSRDGKVGKDWFKAKAGATPIDISVKTFHSISSPAYVYMSETSDGNRKPKVGFDKEWRTRE